MPGRKRARTRRLESTVAYIQHRWGAEAIRRGAGAPESVVCVPTGFAALDAALGIGGLPRGRLSLLAGAPTSGKRTLAALVIAQAQQATRQPAVCIDLAGTCDADYLARCGVDLTAFYVARPATGLEALDMLATLAAQPEWGVVVLDHWAALEREPAARRAAAAALDRLARQLDARQTGARQSGRARAVLLVLDEPPGLWHSLLDAVRGDAADQALGQHCAVRLALRRERWLLLGPDVRGYRVEVAVQKNRFGPTGRSAILEIRFNGTVQGEGL
jgi:recombination protein RecA